MDIKNNPLSRRTFLGLTGATAAVAGMTAYTARRLENERAAEQGDGE